MENSAFLNSSMTTDVARFSFIGIEPFISLKGKKNNIEVTSSGEKFLYEKDPFELLSIILDAYRTENPTHLPFTSGGVGYFSYDLKNVIEKLPEKSKNDLDLADINFVFYRAVLICDKLEPGYVYISVLNEEGSDPNSILENIKNIISSDVYESFQDSHAGRAAPRSLRPGNLESNFTKDEYLSAIEKVLDHIRAGDVYQICLSQRFTAEWDSDPYDLYLRLNTVNPSPFSAYLNFEDVKIISSSPELFLRRRGNLIETRPMKGTRPRGNTSREDTVRKEDLLKSQKDISELLMIVDLERNDLGRIASVGTVEVLDERRIETYPTVFQTVAIIKYKTDSSTNSADIIKAAFPGGSITGCPKIRAMEIIDELEPTARNVYTGSIGYISFHDTMDLNIAIRTMVMKDKNVYFQAGGGIVSDSDPESEYEETLHKASALIESLKQC